MDLLTLSINELMRIELLRCRRLKELEGRARDQEIGSQEARGPGIGARGTQGQGTRDPRGPEIRDKDPGSPETGASVGRDVPGAWDQNKTGDRG
jgi:hypothetical protein